MKNSNPATAFSRRAFLARTGAACAFSFLPKPAWAANATPASAKGSPGFGWQDAEGRTRFRVSARTASEGAQNAGNAFEKPTVGSDVILRGADKFIALNLTWPDTAGKVAVRLERVGLSLSAGTSFAIEVSEDGQRWRRVHAGKWTSEKLAWQWCDFAPVPASHVRVVNTSDSWFNVHGLDFLGRVDADAAAAKFQPPGAVLSLAGLKLQRERILAGKHAAGVTLDELRKKWPAGPWKFEAPTELFASVFQGNRGVKELERDGDRLYATAVVAALTQEPAYARNVVGLLRAWATTCTSVSGGAEPLQLGLNCGAFVMAAEIIKHATPHWDPQLDEIFHRWFATKIVPPMEGRLAVGDDNWSQNIIRTELAWAVASRNRYHFNRLCELWRRNIKARTFAWGETAETTRDLSHCLMGVSGLVNAAEIAWHQGVDLYSWSDATDKEAPLKHRLATIVNYHAAIRNLGPEAQPPPRNPLQRKDWKGYVVTADGKTPLKGGLGGVASFGDEIAYNHYRNRLGLELPELARRVAFTRERKGRDGYIHSAGFATITHGGLDSK